MTNTILNLIEQHGGLLVPGIYDALGARLAAAAGFEACFMSGYAVAGTQLGEPDIGLLTQTEVLAQAQRIAPATPAALIVDADTGYGNELNVARTVRGLISAGAKGCFIEDQVWPKRCGHMEGKQVIPQAEFAAKIAAAVAARGEQDFFICARTDAIATENLEAAIARARAARAAGADACFVEAPPSLDAMRRIAFEVPGPLVANMVEGGKTPLIPTSELFAMGFRFVLYPVSGLFAATAALQEVFGSLRAHGTTAHSRSPKVSFAEFTDIVGLGEKLASARGD